MSVVAVFDVEDGTEGLSAKETRQLGDYLAAQVASIPGTRVVPRDQLRSAIADAKADSYRVCFDQSCQIELGKAVSASKTVATKLLRVGTRCAMTTAIYDLKTETTERAATTRTDCTADALFNAVDALVHELGGPAPKKADVLAVREPPSIERASSERAESERANDRANERRSVAPVRAAREEAPIELVLDESASNPERGPREVSPAPQVSAARDGAPALEVKWTSRRGQRLLRFPRPVAFAENGDALDASAKLVLEQVALAILRDPSLRATKLEVVGHADASERGKAELSERRARAARTFLVERGAPLARLALVAAADRDPLTRGVRANERQQNRRVELRIALEE